ncbi:MAG: helix-turn-helix transcriptional regulator [Lachnospiraceae bacterium]|nr:helix-turn-helix transcriptional regulator [Lachnospiraceae bacterium]
MYNKFKVGPNVREIRNNRGITIAKASDLTGISEEMIAKIEQGNRNMTMQTMFALMEAYDVDANTLLGVSAKDMSIDSRLSALPQGQRNYFTSSFLFMLEQATDAKQEVFA